MRFNFIFPAMTAGSEPNFCAMAPPRTEGVARKTNSAGAPIARKNRHATDVIIFIFQQWGCWRFIPRDEQDARAMLEQLALSTSARNPTSRSANARAPRPPRGEKRHDDRGHHHARRD